jgi:hypothetical protein
MRRKLFIGIDPGVNTGFAIYDPADKSLQLFTFAIHEAFAKVTELMGDNHLQVVIENPSLWTYFKDTKKAKARLQGAGSVKRDFSAWTAFLIDNKIPFRSVRPDKTRNAYAEDAALFGKITGYQKRSSGHARVAAMLVYKK